MDKSITAYHSHKHDRFNLSVSSYIDSLTKEKRQEIASQALKHGMPFRKYIEEMLKKGR